MPADIASTTAQRVTELTNRITSYQNVATPPASDYGARIALADCVATANEEKAYQSGAGSFPNPFNPPGLSNRK